VDPRVGGGEVLPGSEERIPPGPAGKEIPVFSRRESKRRALLKLLERIPLRQSKAASRRKRGQSNFSEPPQPLQPAVPEKLF
jgi:hypothetical protein